jgi:COP9 signalosome complex subunit 4
MESKLNAILSSNSKDKASSYRDLLQDMLRTEAVSDIKTYLQYAVQDQLGLMLSRQIFVDFIELYQSFASKYHEEVNEEILQFALMQLQTRTVAFEEQISSLRVMLADLYESQENWTQAAMMLKGIPMDSGTRTVSNDFKLRIYIRIVRLYLEDEDSVNADAYLNRAQMLEIQDRRLQLELTACQARSMDFKRQFISSAHKYLELSYVSEMDESERIQALTCACVCAVLAPAGPQRTRLLATLYKDDRVRERTELQKNGVAPILEKMHLGRVCKPAHVQEFRQILLPHQLALLPDGSTVLDRAIREHNILSVSRLYNNISFQELGNLLAVSAEQAENLTAQMISEKRLQAKMDQVDKLIYFSRQSTLNIWDEQIAAFCYQLDDIATLIRQRYAYIIVGILNGELQSLLTKKMLLFQIKNLIVVCNNYFYNQARKFQVHCINFS